jgi:hypothetical protein
MWLGTFVSFATLMSLLIISKTVNIAAPYKIQPTSSHSSEIGDDEIRLSYDEQVHPLKRKFNEFAIFD